MSIFFCIFYRITQKINYYLIKGRLIGKHYLIFYIFCINMYFILLFIYLCTILNIVSCTQNFHVYSPLHPCRNTKCAYTDINLSIFIYEPNQISHIITESDFQFFCFILSLSVKYRTPSVVICVFMRLFHVFGAFRPD